MRDQLTHIEESCREKMKVAEEFKEYASDEGETSFIEGACSKLEELVEKSKLA